MMRRFALLLLSLSPIFFSTATTRAQGTRLWSQSKFEELEKGKPEGVAITSDGHLVAGPESKLIYTTPSTYVWSVAADHEGNAYLATGTPATVLKVTPDGKSTRLFSTKDLTVQAVSVGPDGSVYAAVLPSGKVYKLDPQAADRTEDNATVVFDPGTTEEKPKYVWDLAFGSDGRLYIAAGGPAGIYRVAPGSKPELFFKSDEQHIRTLTFDASGNLIAGSDGTGLVYRIDKTGKGYVLFDAPKREITSVVAAPNGAVYAASVGEKGRSNLPPLPVTGTATVTATITIVQPAPFRHSAEIPWSLTARRSTRLLPAARPTSSGPIAMTSCTRFAGLPKACWPPQATAAVCTAFRTAADTRTSRISTHPRPPDSPTRRAGSTSARQTPARSI